MTLLIVILLWLVTSIIIGVAANARGRTGIGWAFLALLISPFLAGLWLFVLPPPDLRKCPMCAELVKREALVCKHCGKPLPPVTTPVRTARQQQREKLVGFVGIGLLVAFILLVSFFRGHH
jgi:hypothetical protein